MPELDSKNCLACGEPGMQTGETIEHYTAPFGRPVPYQHRFTNCNRCGVQVDVSDVDAFPNAIRESERTSIEEILRFFDERGISQASIERQLELPMHCLSHLKKNGTGSSELLALMRILRAFPFIIPVANSHFKEEVAFEKLLQAAKEVGDQDEAV